jgi:hypothetical protein
MEEPHSDGIQQCALETGQNGANQLWPWARAEPLWAGESKRPFNITQWWFLLALAWHRLPHLRIIDTPPFYKSDPSSDGATGLTCRRATRKATLTFRGA